MIITTKDRLTIHEPTAQVTAIAMAEGGVALRVTGGAAYLVADDVRALVRWLTAVSE
jgi:hypothetical protein